MPLICTVCPSLEAPREGDGPSRAATVVSVTWRVERGGNRVHSFPVSRRQTGNRSEVSLLGGRHPERRFNVQSERMNE